jgi:hypothetical protein
MISDRKFQRLVKKTCLEFLCLFSILFFLTNVAICQDSLYLIGTITGESNAKRITDVKGIGDVNGDGYADFMITTVNNTVTLYFGSQNINLTPSIVFHYPGKEKLFAFGGCAGIGDVNGDGYDDFVLKGEFYDSGRTSGNIFVYYGGPTIDTIPKYEFYDQWMQDMFGLLVQNVGDINKDGYNDFAVSNPYNWSDGKGRVYLFYGGDTISFAKSTTFIDTLAIGKLIDSFFGVSVANIGDVNGDGFDDLAISASYNLSEPSEKVYIYYGGKTMHTNPDTILTSNNLDYDFGRIIERCGDLMKVGTVPYIIAGLNDVFIYNGLKQICNPIINDGGGCGSGGDVNGDGYYDLIIGNKKGIDVYYGRSNGLDTTIDCSIIRVDSLIGFGSNISIAGDINRDGYDEIIALSPNWPNVDNPRGIITIYSAKKQTGVKGYRETTPCAFNLFQNYPNPFNPNTVISYKLPITCYINLKVYDILGREITILFDGKQIAGVHRINFDGLKLSSGMYVYRLIAGKSVIQKTMMLIK